MDLKFFVRQIIEIIISPVKTWKTVSAEKKKASYIRNNLLFPIVLIVAICSLLGSFLIANVSQKFIYSVFVAVRYFCLDLIVVYLSALILREITKALDLKSDYSSSLIIITYSLIPFFICQMISLLFESLAFVNILALYGLWIMRSGFDSILNPPDYKKTPMLVAVFVVITEIYVGFSIALASLVERIYFGFFA